MKTTLRIIISVLVLLAALALLALGLIAIACFYAVAEHVAFWVHPHPWVMVLAGLFVIGGIVSALDEATK